MPLQDALVKHLRQIKGTLISNLYPDILLLENLIAENVICESDRQYIDAEPTVTQKNSILIDIILRGSERKFQCFRKVLACTHHGHVLKYLDEALTGQILPIHVEFNDVNASPERETKILMMLENLASIVPENGNANWTLFQLSNDQRRILEKLLKDIRGQIIGGRLTQSILIYMHCSTIDGMENIWKLYESGQLKELLQNLCRCLANDESTTVKVSINPQDYEKCKEEYSNIQENQSVSVSTSMLYPSTIKPLSTSDQGMTTKDSSETLAISSKNVREDTPARCNEDKLAVNKSCKSYSTQSGDWKDCIVTNMKELVEDLDTGTRLASCMKEYKVLRPQIITRLWGYKNPVQRTTKILDQIRIGDDDRFNRFCEALIASGQEHIVTKYLKTPNARSDVTDAVPAVDDELELEALSHEITDFLDKNCNKILDLLVSDDVFLGLLEKYSILQRTHVMKFESMEIEEDRSSHILDHLKRCSVATYNRFRTALRENDQKVLFNFLPEPPCHSASSGTPVTEPGHVPASAHVPDLEQGLDRMRLQQCTQNEGGRIEPALTQEHGIEQDLDRNVIHQCTEDEGESGKPGDHLSRLRTIYPKLIGRFDAKKLAGLMFSQRAIEHKELQSILSCRTAIDAAESLLNIILNEQSESIFNCFLSALNETNQHHISACILHPDYDIDSEHVQLIQINHVFLVENIDSLDSGLLDELLSRGVIDLRDLEQLRAEQTQTSCIEKLLSMLACKSAQQFEEFLSSLRASGQPSVAEKLVGSDQTTGIHYYDNTDNSVAETCVPVQSNDCVPSGQHPQDSDTDDCLPSGQHPQDSDTDDCLPSGQHPQDSDTDDCLPSGQHPQDLDTDFPPDDKLTHRKTSAPDPVSAPAPLSVPDPVNVPVSASEPVRAPDPVSVLDPVSDPASALVASSEQVSSEQQPQDSKADTPSNEKKTSMASIC